MIVGVGMGGERLMLLMIFSEVCVEKCFELLFQVLSLIGNEVGLCICVEFGRTEPVETSFFRTGSIYYPVYSWSV